MTVHDTCDSESGFGATSDDAGSQAGRLSKEMLAKLRLKRVNAYVHAEPEKGATTQAAKSKREFREQLKAEGNPNPDELINLVRSRKGSAHAPKQVRFVRQLPMTGVGKVDKKVLRAGFWTGRDRLIG